MKAFLNENFLLDTPAAEKLYHGYARDLPIIDYHNHLPPSEISADLQFENITQAWLYGDHYKWRAMRANGVNEKYCTGNAPDEEKFTRWAQTVPYTMRNPLYIWTHLELRRYFGIEELLSGQSAAHIYRQCSSLLNTPDYSVRSLLRKMKVKVVCTTDDPIDTLEHHQRIAADNVEISVFPTFRPDKAMNADNPAAFCRYVDQLEAVTNTGISSLNQYLDALKSRHDFFDRMGAVSSDHGLSEISFTDYTEGTVQKAFQKIRQGQAVTGEEALQFKSFMLETFALWNYEKGWVQQFHLGALRNNNSRMLHKLGADTGWDSIGDFPQATALARFLDRLDRNDTLAKTILYNLNPADNAVMAAMTGNFNDGTLPGKIQWGSAWWFLDQKDGMINQLNTLSNMGLISRFVGMLTDSRSFLSFPRHEYFRRVLCHLFGTEIENGELPADMEWIGKLIQDICLYNTARYFNWKKDPL